MRKAQYYKAITVFALLPARGVNYITFYLVLVIYSVIFIIIIIIIIICRF